MREMILRALAPLLLFGCSAEAQTLRKVSAIELPGPKGERFDYLTIDDEDHWLLSAHLGPGILYVIDARTNKLVKAISGLPRITGSGIRAGAPQGLHRELGRRKNWRRGLAKHDGR